MRKERKIYIGVFALAFLALIADQAFLSGGSGTTEAQATVPPPSGAADDALPGGVASAGEPLPGAKSRPGTRARLADCLERLAEARRADPLGAPDAFRPFEAWRKPRRPETRPAPQTQPAREDPAEVFRRTHRLNAVLTGGPQPMAVINNRAVPPEQSVDGFRLVSVRPNAAVLRRGDVRVELSLRVKPDLRGNRQSQAGPVRQTP